MIMIVSEEFIARWSRSPWKDAIECIADKDCERAAFDELLSRLYPHGDRYSVSETHRGKAELLDFRGITLSGMDLSGVEFFKFDLRASDFSASEISGCCMDCANIGDSNFSFVKCSGLSFSEGFSSGVIFDGAEFRESDLSRTDFSGSSFVRSKIIECNFSGSILTNVNFLDSMITRCDFSNSYISNSCRSIIESSEGGCIGLDSIRWV